jgi:hypothetical protein
MSTHAKMTARLKLSAILLIIGLLFESICLLWSRPLSFVFMVSVGGPLVFAGVVTYLLAIASSDSDGSTLRP